MFYLQSSIHAVQGQSFTAQQWLAVCRKQGHNKETGMEGMITVPAKHFVINKQDKIACDM